MDKAIPDGPRIINMSDVETRNGPGAVVEALGLLSAALKIDPKLSGGRERVQWRLARAVMLLEWYIDSEANE